MLRPMTSIMPYKLICFIKRLMLLSYLCLGGCSEEAPNKEFTILTTTSMLADLVKNIVQEDAHVASLMGPGIDPHTYQITPKDAQKLKTSDIIIYNGLYLEGKMVELFERLAKERVIFAAGDALKKEQLIFDEETFPMGTDPHIWFDVKLWQAVVNFLSQKLQAIKPASAAYYQHNTVAYLEKLESLHREVTTRIQSIPAKQRILVTVHDAFSYFGRAYDIQVVGLQGISTATECGLQDIGRIVDLIVNNNIKAIFLETSVSDKSMRAVLERCAHYGHKVAIGGALYSDALGAENTLEGTYCGMVQANTEMIVNALK